ncbi:MAG: hypothetical protein WB783_20290 [Arenicellales bacterium]
MTFDLTKPGNRALAQTKLPSMPVVPDPSMFRVQAARCVDHTVSAPRSTLVPISRKRDGRAL